MILLKRCFGDEHCLVTGSARGVSFVSYRHNFLIKIMFILMAIQFYYKGSYDKQNLTLVVISNEIYEKSFWRVS